MMDTLNTDPDLSRSLPAPQARRGQSVAPNRSGPEKPSLFRSALREVKEHPLQTAALLVFAYALNRSPRATDADKAKTVPAAAVTKRSSRAPLAIPMGVLASACLVALASCATSGAGTSSGGARPSAELVADGRMYASLRCASCHALDRDDFSPNPMAPPMKTLSPRLEFKLLERDRVQGVVLRHGEMPPLELSLHDKEVLTAYLESIAAPPR